MMVDTYDFREDELWLLADYCYELTIMPAAASTGGLRCSYGLRTEASKPTLVFQSFECTGKQLSSCGMR